MKNLIFKTLILATFLLMNGYSDAQWVQRYNGPGNSLDAGRTITVDVLGNVYVAETVMEQVLKKIILQ